jgi:spermidine/putrescine-binding protein
MEMEEHHIGGEDMAKTLDDMVDERVEKRVREIMKPLLKRMELMEKAIETLEKWRDDALAIDGERLITLTEASRRLLVNPAKLREMIASGDIAIASTPNGRNKVLASSVTKCIERLQGRAV